MSGIHSIGFDFGTESVRVIVADVRTGRVAAQAVAVYAQGVIDRSLPVAGGAALPSDFALQHPQDWIDAAGAACRRALRDGVVSAESVVGIGVAFTSCTMLPTLRDGTPLCLVDAFAREPQAWPKLWKHHGARAEADRINAVARERQEPWLDRYGGGVSLEWFFPKIFETLNAAPPVYQAAAVWIEAGDWFVWHLTGTLMRSACQAGYKACWSKREGYPSRSYFAAVDARMADVVNKLPGAVQSPGARAGGLTASSAERFGLRPGTPVSVATIDAHAGVPGAGVASTSVMTLVLGTSACQMLNSATARTVPGLAGVVEDGILPGYFGYETGQACVGDALGWVSRTTGVSHGELNRRAAELRPGSGGVLAIDWLNGCRTPLMDPRVSGALIGLTLATRPEQLYRAMIEGTAMGLRWICDTLTEGGVAIEAFIAAGGLPAKSPLLMQIYADVLGRPIALAEAEQAVALGAAIFGAMAAGTGVTGHATIGDIIHAMARQRSDLRYEPDPQTREAYGRLYALYRSATAGDAVLADVMRRLRTISY